LLTTAQDVRLPGVGIDANHGRQTRRGCGNTIDQIIVAANAAEMVKVQRQWLTCTVAADFGEAVDTGVQVTANQRFVVQKVVGA
jgi:regulator of extracellular matrix RemA (YlzA/DUF370 family)